MALRRGRASVSKGSARVQHRPAAVEQGPAPCPARLPITPEYSAGSAAMSNSFMLSVCRRVFTVSIGYSTKSTAAPATAPAIMPCTKLS